MTCGTGLQKSNREVIQEPMFGGEKCPTLFHQERQCVLPECEGKDFPLTPCYTPCYTPAICSIFSISYLVLLLLYKYGYVILLLMYWKLILFIQLYCRWSADAVNRIGS